MRAGVEYKSLIQQYKESSLLPEAKQRMREVQEILAERQYRIANFYYRRNNVAAAQARLQSLIESYPLYSGIDSALYQLGSLYEKEAAAGVDVAVVDYRMPAMNGCVLADFLRARHPDLRIILYSGESDIPEGEMSSVDAFVPKGSGVQPLLAQVSQLTNAGLYEVREFATSSSLHGT